MGQNDWWDLCIVGCGTVIHCTGWGREGNGGGDLVGSCLAVIVVLSSK